MFRFLLFAGGQQQRNGSGIVAVELFHLGRQEQRSKHPLCKASRRVGWVEGKA